MTRSALILAAHGSNHEPAVNEQIREYARQVSARTRFDEYGVTFHQGDPHFSKVLDGLTATEITIVPVMVSDGYYYSTVLPRELAKNARYDEVSVRITPPVGTHEAIESLVRRRASLLVEQFNLSAATTSLAIVGHGTPKNRQSRVSTIDVVDAISRDRLFQEVIPAFLDEEPFVDSILPRAASSAVVVIPFLIAAGAHASQDIPRRMGIALANNSKRPASVNIDERTVVIDQSIGMDLGIIDILVDLAMGGEGRASVSPAGAWGEEGRSIPTASAVGCPRSPLPRLDKENGNITETASHLAVAIYPSSKPLKLGTRASKLALWQANHVAGLLQARGAQVEVVEITTSGDRRLDLAIADLPSDAPFTDDIEESLRRGEIDLAVHALKDLPVFGADDLTIAAVLPRGDASEALVSHGRLTLHELAAGGVIGTSSPRRSAQLLALRPDLRTTPIRGAVDARVRDVHAGLFDAVILATAGLERLGLLGEIAEQFAISAFLPAPGQAALVIQTRIDDAKTIAAVSVLEDGPSRVATDAELALLRYFDHRTGIALSAYAHLVNHQLRLHARLSTIDGTRSHECHVVGTNAREAADDAAEQLMNAFADIMGAVA